jgi:hypothetical protein
VQPNDEQQEPDDDEPDDPRMVGPSFVKQQRRQPRRPGYYDGIAKPIASAERPKPADLAQLGAAE